MRRLLEKALKNKLQAVAVLGGALTAISILFEYARNSPAYNFLVFPWSIRGWETQRGWVMVAAGVILIGMALIDPEKRLFMGLRRLHMLAALVAWAYITFSAGALRTALIAKQFRTPQISDAGDAYTGISASYRDVQITSGWILAVVGTMLAFVGAVGMWGRRRDQKAAQQRAERQRHAAEESRRELEEARA